MDHSKKYRSYAWKWISQDPEEEYRNHIKSLIFNEDEDELHELFGAELKFGTAGLRGRLGPGPNRMNLAVVRRTSFGISQMVLQQNPSNPSIVVGYDARHRSREFAIDAAVLFCAAGIHVHFIDKLAATPYLAHAVVKHKCTAGVMITASHNPPQDNGYKVYWGNGAQIVPPIDQNISSFIDSLNHEHIEFELEDDQDIYELPDETLEGYFDAVQKLRVHDKTGAKIIYTPLHGVGTEYVETVLSRAGHEFITVPEQREANPDFPTVQFPNPEEPGAMDMALELAKTTGSDIIIANDPDADRLAVIALHDGNYRAFTGNQIGLLLAEDLLTNGDWGDNPMVATTIVSSSQLKTIAEAHGAAYTETLTGFKWIANEAIRHDSSGGQFVIGFEEALGYSVGSVARDKDGVSAALLVADLASYAKSQNKTLWDLHDELVLKYGLTASDLVSIKKHGLEGTEEIKLMLDQLRNNPPIEIAGSSVIETCDYWQKIKKGRDGNTEKLSLPKSNVLVYFLEDGARIIVRPSGTEPKIKFYYEAKAYPTQIEAIPACSEQLVQRIQALKSAMQAITAGG